MTVEAYYFEIATLTREEFNFFTEDESKNPEKCQRLLKPGVIDTLCILLEKGHRIAIITDKAENIIPEILEGAGLAKDKVAQISIYKDNSSNVLSNSIEKYTTTTNHYFYSTNVFSCDKVSELKFKPDKPQKLKPEFDSDQKKLFIRRVDANDRKFLSEIREKYKDISKPIPNKINISNNQTKISNNRYSFHSSPHTPAPITEEEHLLKLAKNNDCCSIGCTIL